MAGATSQARKLNLWKNKLTSAAVPPLVELVNSGVMPQLERMALVRPGQEPEIHNEIDESAVALLQAACEAHNVTLVI